MKCHLQVVLHQILHLIILTRFHFSVNSSFPCYNYNHAVYTLSAKDLVINSMCGIMQHRHITLTKDFEYWYCIPLNAWRFLHSQIAQDDKLHLFLVKDKEQERIIIIASSNRLIESNHIIVSGTTANLLKCFVQYLILRY